MRPLTDEETISLLTKLKTYIGDRIRHLLNNESDPHVFRIQRGRVYYMSTAILGHCGNFQRKVLTCAGTKFGRFNKSGDFRLHVTALDYLAQHALCKVWLKPAAEMSFLFGNHVVRERCFLSPTASIHCSHLSLSRTRARPAPIFVLLTPPPPPPPPPPRRAARLFPRADEVWCRQDE